MKQILLYIPILLLLLAIDGCSARNHSSDKVITISIPPLEKLVTDIVGEDYKINTILQSGWTPENYSPTPSQLIHTEQSEFVFFVGTLAFEQSVAQRLGSKGLNVINTGRMASLISGQCTDYNHIDANHNHGTDPHIWMSLIELEKIVRNIGEALCKAHPDSIRYKANYERLIARIRAQHTSYQHLFGQNEKVGKFAIYHPALGYFARDYGLEQVSVENEGKAPTPSTIAKLSGIINNSQIEELLYQQEYPLDVVKPIADILNLKPLIINPLSSDILTEIDRIVNILSTPNYASEGTD